MLEPLRLSFEIACAPAHAFEVWTTKIGAWWPTGHSASGDPATAVELEPRVGGRIYERTSSGTEIDWGEVTVWEPPHRLGYLWHISRSRDGATDVELTFVDAGDGSTRLEVVQSGWERAGAEAETWRDANAGGWGNLIPHFVAAVAAGTSSGSGQGSR
jgi:hypothetical protein